MMKVLAEQGLKGLIAKGSEAIAEKLDPNDIKPLLCDFVDFANKLKKSCFGQISPFSALNPDTPYGAPRPAFSALAYDVSLDFPVGGFNPKPSKLEPSKLGDDWLNFRSTLVGETVERRDAHPLLLLGGVLVDQLTSGYLNGVLDDYRGVHKLYYNGLGLDYDRVGYLFDDIQMEGGAVICLGGDIKICIKPMPNPFASPEGNGVEIWLNW